ncbi:anthranilate phosphoribosyltransferase [Thioalkalivibrio sp. ALE19]|uniref:anthranilate phosphoribosyltransferase n=1 Tax=Thioalkalivibrio sp. ALE19 TaxID=1266909 RepID=UPI0003F85F30|nr:anthranilate phosphoribosyltransferase [Thioalkalivibrio sp. ALE19]
MREAANVSPDPAAVMRDCIQKVATGPELSKDLSRDEARAAMQAILEGHVDPVQAAVFLIGLRMKRETLEESEGVLQALRDHATTAVADVDHLIDIADPYDGHVRGLPATAFLPAVLAACGQPAVCHGIESIGPKFGATPRMVLRAAGVDTDLSPQAAAARIVREDIGWAYVDMHAFCPGLHALTDLRNLIIKRNTLTTVENLVGPVRARGRTHIMVGYVHKAYPPVYAHLARYSGFASGLVVRGGEGGVIPSLQQPGRAFLYRDGGPERELALDPAALGIRAESRAVPLPSGIVSTEAGNGAQPQADGREVAPEAARAGLAALRGESGPMRDSLIYAGALALHHLGGEEDMNSAAERVRQVLDDGSALVRFAG